MKIHVFYHHDTDGILSALIYKDYLNTQEHIEATFTKLDYADKDYKEKLDLAVRSNVNLIVFLDICPDAKSLASMQEYIGAKFLNTIISILDHHYARVQQAYGVQDPAITNISLFKSAACLGVYKYFNPDVEVPRIIKALAAYDIHDFSEISKIESVIYELGFEKKCISPDNTSLSILLSRDTELYEAGNLTYFEIREVLLKTIERTGEILTIDGNKYLMINSDLGELSKFDIDKELSENLSGYIYFYFKPELQSFKFSIRSLNEDIPVLPIAEYWGGGGHPMACGFTLTISEFQEFLDMYSTNDSQGVPSGV